MQANPAMPQQPQGAADPSMMKSKVIAIALHPEVIGDPETAKFDVIVDQSASAPNQKEATWAVLSQMGPMLKDVITPPVLLKLLEYSPLPESLLEEIKVIASQQAQSQPPSPEEIKLQMDRERMQMEQQRDQAKMQMEQQGEQAKLGIERERHQMQMAAEQAKMNWEREKMMMEIELEAAKARNDMDIEMFKAENDAEIKRYSAQRGAEVSAFVAQQREANRPKPNGKGKTN